MRARVRRSPFAGELLVGVVAVTVLWGRPCEATPPAIGHIVTGGAFVESSRDGEGLLAAAATLDERGAAAGAFLFSVPSAQLRTIVSVQRGRVEAEGAAFEGSGVAEVQGRVAVRDSGASVFVTRGGDLFIRVGDVEIIGETIVGEIRIREFPPAGQADGDTPFREVGHWLGLFDTGSAAEPPVIAFGAISLGDRTDVEGYPEVAGLFRDTADGETGHAHGHLDFLKQVGDPATARPSGSTIGFEASGEGECFEAGAEAAWTSIVLNLDLEAGALEFEAPECSFLERMPVAQLACPGRCLRTVIVGPDPGR
jgi:hypothetical protein